MALITPEYLQTQKYSALRDRLTLMHGGTVQPGVWDAADFKVIQRAAGAAMAVDIGAGFALVPANSSANAGLYHVQNDAPITNLAVSPSNATLPRIDQIILTVNDTTHGGGSSDVPALTVLTGTATSGTTLDTRVGAAALPANSIRLADILIPAASASVVTANIRDRRPWARGASWRIRRGNLGANLTTTSTTPVDVDAVNVTPRIECSGVPVVVTLTAQTESPTAYPIFQLAVDGVINDGQRDRWGGVGVRINPMYLWDFTPTPGSHVFRPQWSSNNGNVATIIQSGIRDEWTFTVRELPGQNASND